MGGGKKITYSKTMKDEEIYRRYGRPNYDGYDPNNSSIPGFTRGRG